MAKASKVGSLTTFVRCLAYLTALVAIGSGTLGLAKNNPNPQKDAWAVTLRVYDYAQMHRPALRAAEGEATEILAQAGVEPRWVDCPTSHAVLDNYPNCQSAWQGINYVLRVLPKAMAGLLEKSQDSLGSAMECDMAPYCTASVFYDSVMSLAIDTSAPGPVLLGRVMAHEIGHVLLGSNSHSLTGIMRPFWSDNQLRPYAFPELLFTAEQSRRIKSRLAAASGSRGERDLAITVRVYDYAHVRPGALIAAEQQAGRIFHKTGLTMNWCNVPIGTAESLLDSICGQPAGRAGLDLRIVARLKVVPGLTADSTMGSAWGDSATVSYHWGKAADPTGEAMSWDILACVIAHEIGHVLLGPNSHSTTGIMTGEWSHDVLRDAGEGRLRFTPQQAELIRAEVLARSGERRASMAQTLAFEP